MLNKNMCFLLVVLVCAVAGCGDLKRNPSLEYAIIEKRLSIAYAGADAMLAYQAMKDFLEYVKVHEHDGSNIPVEHINVWGFARLGLLAEHLGRREESKEYFAIASANAKRAYPESPPETVSETGLRATLEVLDTPEKCLWRAGRVTDFF